jgi:hypothetical protein
MRFKAALILTIFLLLCTLAGLAAEQNQCSKPTISKAKSKSPPLKVQTSSAQKIQIYNFYMDQSQGAFWLLVPQGWEIEGGIVSQLFQPSRINFTIAHPEGWGGIRFIPGAKYLPPDYYFRQPGSVDQYGNIYMPFMEPANYLQQLVVPNLYASGSPSIIKVQELPNVAASLQNFHQLVGIAIPEARVVELSLEVSEGGIAYLDRLIAIVYIYGVMNDRVWETQIIQVRARKDKLAEVEPLLMTSLASFQLNPNWLAAAAKAERARTEVRMRYQKEIIEIQESMMKHRAAFNDEMSHSIGMELADQANFVDTKTGEIRTLTSSYNNTWTNGNGTFVQSNSSNFNPNDPSVQQQMGLSGDFREMQRK